MKVALSCPHYQCPPRVWPPISVEVCSLPIVWIILTGLTNIKYHQCDHQHSCQRRLPFASISFAGSRNTNPDWMWPRRIVFLREIKPLINIVLFSRNKLICLNVVHRSTELCFLTWIMCSLLLQCWKENLDAQILFFKSRTANICCPLHCDRYWQFDPQYIIRVITDRWHPGNVFRVLF